MALAISPWRGKSYVVGFSILPIISNFRPQTSVWPPHYWDNYAEVTLDMGCYEVLRVKLTDLSSKLLTASCSANFLNFLLFGKLLMALSTLQRWIYLMGLKTNKLVAFIGYILNSHMVIRLPDIEFK